MHPGAVVSLRVGFALLLLGASWSCAAGSSADEVRDDVAQDLVLPDPGPDGDACPYMDCSYLNAHYIGFQPTYEECLQKLTGPSGCEDCCTRSWGKVIATRWCCPHDDVEDAADETEVVADP